MAECPNSDNDFLHTELSHWPTKFGDVPDVLPAKQPFWDRPGVLEDKALVEASVHTAHHQASFLAASSQHSGGWLLVLLIASCGLKLDDEAVRVAVGLRLGLVLCVPHNCHCGSPVDARGFHSFVCKRAPGRSSKVKLELKESIQASISKLEEEAPERVGKSTSTGARCSGTG